MGGMEFGWLAVWDLSPDWLIRKLKVCDFFRRFGEAAAPGWGGGWAVYLLAPYTMAFALQMRKITENLRVAEKRSALQSRKRFV
jgi:hypothetical protein